MAITFTVLGEPNGKGRPCFARRGNYVSTYTPEKTVLYENLIKTEYRLQVGVKKFPKGVPLDMRIKVFLSIPASASKKNQILMEAGELRPTKKPDNDNVEKVIADALNGIAFHDDAQIVDNQTRKFYSYTPRVEVILQEASANGEQFELF